MTARSVRVLVASDRAEAIDRVRNELADATLAWSFDVTTASSISDFWTSIAEAPPEVVILDGRFAPLRGLPILHSLGAKGIRVPLILLADSDKDPLAEEAVRAGAVECLPLDSLTHRALVSSIRYAVDLGRKERKGRNTEEALRKAEEQLREIVRHAGIMTCTHDLSGTILSIDEPASRALGYPAPDLVGTSIRDFLEPGHRSDFDGYLDEIRRSHTATGFMAVVTREGETRYWNYQNRLFQDDGGAPVVQGTAIDVTERIQAEAAAAVYAQRQAAILDALPAQVALLGEDGTILSVNTAWSRFAEDSGSDPQDSGKGTNYFAGCRGAHGMATETSETVTAGIRDVLAGKSETYSTEYACETPGHRRWFRLVVSPVRGRVRGAVVMHIDRTAQKKAEEELERQVMIFENMYDAVTIADAANTIVGWNRGAEKMYGISRSQAIGKPISILAPTAEEKEKTEKVTEIAAREGRWSGERFFQKRDGTPGIRELLVLALRDSSGNLLGTAGISRDISERKESELALRASEERFRLLFERNLAGVYRTTVDGRILECNDAFARILGYSRDELRAKNARHLYFNEQDRDVFLNQVTKKRSVGGIESCLRHRDGSRVWVIENIALVEGGPGGVCLEGSLIDISDRRAAEQALRASEEKYRKIVDFAPVGIYQTTVDGKLLTCNESFARIFGWPSAAEMIVNGTTVELFDAPSERQRLIDSHRQTGFAENVELHLKRRDGSKVWVQITAQLHPDESGEIDHFEGFVVDISERKRVEEQQARLQGAVLEAARQWRDTFDAIETPVLIVDSSGVVKRLNRAAVQTAGATYLEILGKSLQNIGPQEPWQRAAALIRNMGGAGSAPDVLCRDEISQHTWELSVSRFETPPPENSLFILVARDITPVVELQESVMKSQSMSAMGALVAGVAHEVRNPLFAISATLDAFDLRFRDQDAYKKYAQALRMQLDRMNDLMHDLLDYGKPAVYVIRDVPLEEVVGEAIRICSDHAARRSVQLSYGEEKALPAVRVDRSRTVQVFVNLIENAIEHSPPGGVRIRAERSDDERTIRCSIEDEGPGFRPDDLPRVFEPFFTRRQGGTGLGLSIVRRIVTEQGGTVIPSNRPGAGACVTLTFPCAVGDAVAPAREATS